MVSAEQCSRAMRRKRRRVDDNLVKTAARAQILLHLGELSAARQALEGAEVTPGTVRTLSAFANPEKRSPFTRAPVPDDTDTYEPTSLFDLDRDRLYSNVRTARCRRWAIFHDSRTLSSFVPDRACGEARQDHSSAEANCREAQHPTSTLTRDGCQCAPHIVQTLTDADGQATDVSTDGIG